jgi:Trk-type K+ transport system membrane component
LNRASVLGVGFQLWYAFFGDKRLINVLISDLLTFTLVITSILVILGSLLIIIYRKTDEIWRFNKKTHDQICASVEITNNMLQLLTSNQPEKSEDLFKIEASDSSISHP